MMYSYKMMIYYFFFISTLMVVVLSQRPSYAGQRPIRYPGLANRFKDDNVTSTSNAPSPSLEDRFGESVTNSNLNLPVDARGDTLLVDRLNKWPEENRPFWLLNANQIEKHRGNNGNVNISNGPPTDPLLPVESNQNNVDRPTINRRTSFERRRAFVPN